MSSKATENTTSSLNRYSHINWWKGIPKGLKTEDSSVSCAYEKNHRADECLAGILSQPGVHGKSGKGLSSSIVVADPVSVQDLRKNVQCQAGDAVCRAAQADGGDRSGSNEVFVWLSGASDCACLWVG